MNVVVEPQANCIVTLHVEVPAERVDREWNQVASEFQRFAKVPGYRPGKAPASVILSRFAKDIREELKKKLLNESMREAIKGKNLSVISVSRVDGVELAADKILRYTATVITSPEFELPDYSSIELDIERRAVADTDVDAMLDRLREQHATYEPVDGRGLEDGDFAVLTYEGRLDGQLLSEAVPSSPKLLQSRQNGWVQMEKDAILPGFSDALLGAQTNDERTFDLVVPADFPVTELQGKTLSYRVGVNAINSRALPELDDALAAKILPGKTLAELRTTIQETLAGQAEEEFETKRRSGAMQFLLSKVDCELPAELVKNEMDGILSEIVKENQVRGVSDDELRAHQDELIGVAQQNARDRVRGTFLLLKVAEKEKLQVTEQDLAMRVTALASRYGISVQKMVKDLRRRDAFGALREQILTGKALDLLVSNVTVRGEPIPATANP